METDAHQQGSIHKISEQLKGCDVLMKKLFRWISQNTDK